ncbi:MAG: hypothetical protein LBV67_06235 [Streptococcaceae bacterium]|jgi:RNA polymerase sigma-70 factor (ECF subfamily)|nr:hypothetical protein [Streptococcaceae bacterium]
MNTKGYCQKLVRQYQEDLEPLRKRSQKLTAQLANAHCDLLKNELRIVNGMISDTNYSINWMKHFREPGNRREITRRSQLQRTMLIDSMDYFGELIGDSVVEPNQKEVAELENILNSLSPREKEAMWLHKGYGYTHSETADLMGISIGTVKTNIFRAFGKIHLAKASKMQSLSTVCHL